MEFVFLIVILNPKKIIVYKSWKKKETNRIIQVPLLNFFLLKQNIVVVLVVLYIILLPVGYPCIGTVLSCSFYE